MQVMLRGTKRGDIGELRGMMEALQNLTRRQKDWIDQDWVVASFLKDQKKSHRLFELFKDEILRKRIVMRAFLRVNDLAATSLEEQKILASLQTQLSLLETTDCRQELCCSMATRASAKLRELGPYSLVDTDVARIAQVFSDCVSLPDFSLHEEIIGILSDICGPDTSRIESITSGICKGLAEPGRPKAMVGRLQSLKTKVGRSCFLFCYSTLTPIADAKHPTR